MNADNCKQCNGTGAVDSGASAPWGEFYKEPCQDCSGTGSEAFGLLEWACSLIASAQPNEKVLSPEHCAQWHEGFGKFWAAAQTHIGNRLAKREQAGKDGAR